MKNKLALLAAIAIGVIFLAGLVTGFVERINERMNEARPQASPSLAAPTPAAQQSWKNPQVACKLLSHVEGFKTEGYKGEDNNYTCLSYPYKLGDDLPLPNTIAFYANGDAQTVKELELYLNVNVRQKEKAARDALALHGGELVSRALDAPLPAEAKEAIKKGGQGKWNIKDALVELTRDDWPTGKGYSLKLLIK